MAGRFRELRAPTGRDVAGDIQPHTLRARMHTHPTAPHSAYTPHASRHHATPSLPCKPPICSRTRRGTSPQPTGGEWRHTPVSRYGAGTEATKRSGLREGRYGGRDRSRIKPHQTKPDPLLLPGVPPYRSGPTFSSKVERARAPDAAVRGHCSNPGRRRSEAMACSPCQPWSP